MIIINNYIIIINNLVREGERNNTKINDLNMFNSVFNTK